jgi:alcohol dehydrogenase class IV
MNALAHAIEALYTPLANPVADDAALMAAVCISSGLTSDDRHALALGALLAGYASGSAGFAVHHAVCQTIVRMAGSPHAQTNAVMLPHFVRMMEGKAPGAIERLAGVLDSTDAAGRVSELSAQAGVTRLGELGVERDQIDGIVEAALKHPAVGNTPDPPGEAELRELLQSAI